METGLQGVIFDLDGTLIDSKLNFEAIRCDIGLPAGQPILEALAGMPDGSDKQAALEILRRHELHGAEVATPMPGVEQFLDELDRRQILRAVLTRNSRESTDIVLERLGLEFSPVLTREDAPPKPDPVGLLHVCREWQVSARRVLFVGDFLFDLQAGRNAGMRTVLYARGALPEYADQADFVIREFREAGPLIAGLCGDDQGKADEF